MSEPRILTGDDFTDDAGAVRWLIAQALDQCDEGPCGDDPDCPCNERTDRE